MSAKVANNCCFFHLLRFLHMETTSKRAKRPAVSETGEHVLTQYERQLRIEEDLAHATIRNYLSDLRHFAAWCESIWKQGREKNLLSRLGSSLLKKYAERAHVSDVSPHDLRHRFGYRMAEVVPLHRLAQLMGHDSLDTTLLYVQAT